jgi:anti-anti-sigma regulatory factor
MLVMVGHQFACIRIIGRANFSSSIDFKSLVNQLRQKGYRYFVLELSECVLMDSTFLGVLAGFGLKSISNDQDKPRIELLSPNARILELLENLGVLDLFVVTARELQVPPDAQVSDHTPVSASKEELTRACIEAHETLMALNPANVAKFKDVTQFMAEDLKRLGGDKQSPS